MKKTIAISLSPNTEANDVFKAIGAFFSPWQWFGSSSVKQLEGWFRDFFGVSYAVSFASGRAALAGLLKSFDCRSGDEILLQAFTCVAVADAILATGATPVYVDVLQNVTIDSADLEKKITKKTKGIVVQHTFGISADMKAVSAIAKKNKLFVVEDCAHVISQESGKSGKLGTLSDGAIFSFGRDKAFSSVAGGMAIINNKNAGEKLRTFQKNLKNASVLWTMQQLFHPIAFSIILPLYNVSKAGKALLIAVQKLHVLSFPVLPIEKEGKIADVFMRKYPNPLASLALHQLTKMQTYNSHRLELSKIYIESLNKKKYTFASDAAISYLRFPVFTPKRDEILKNLRKKGIYLGNWYANCIDPKGTDFATINYNPKSCPKAEKFARLVLNLPTNQSVSSQDARNIVTILNSC